MGDITVTPRVASDNDDALAYPSTLEVTTESSLYIGNDGGSNYNGLRFQLNVPPDVTITAAKLTFVAYASGSNTTCNATITYQDADSPANFAGDDYAAFMARTRSADSIAWNNVGAWTAETTYDSPSLVTLIQALVNEAYWNQNDYCVLFVEDNSSSANALRRAYSAHSDLAKAALLTVTYTALTSVPVIMNQLRQQGIS